MAYLFKQYKAKCIEERIGFILKEKEKLCSNHIGQTGILWAYISENKYPGKPFVIFHSKEGALRTSRVI